MKKLYTFFGKIDKIKIKLLVVISIFIAGGSSAVILVQSNLINVVAGNRSALPFVLGTLVALLAINELVRSLNNMVLSGMVIDTKYQTRKNLIEYTDKILFDEIKKPEFLESVKQVEHFNETCEKIINFLLGNIVAIVTLLIYVLYSFINVSWYLTVSVLAYGVVQLLISKKTKNESDFWQKYIQNMARANYFSNTLIAKEYIEERHLFASEPLLTSKFSRNFKDAMTKNISAAKERLKNDVGFVVLEFMFVSAILIASIFECSRGKITLGGVYLIGMMIMIITSSIKVVYNNSSDIRRSLPVIECLEEMINARKNPDGIVLDDIAKITLKNLGFSYGDIKTIDDVSYEFEPGNNYYIVGSNGSGKSTLIKLLSGLIGDYSGEFFVNDIDIRDLKMSEIVACCFQNNNKYPLTYQENIEFVDDPDGVELSDLSGGQWGKLKIKRLEFRNAPINLFDEPTAAMDPNTELDFINFFKSYKSVDRINIMITHRFGSIEADDKILVMDSGRLIETGSHEVLLAQKGRYFEMFEKQKARFEI
ncbi:MAG: ABC transporter ATP-binding protein/permease [Lactobacillales bacterium]|jgi:ABC-type multidrug transport system fused ATPase/permease subunit|nr:ABC transporter ATP-binding protein/permease [Lactobacillales bacterium]